MGTIGPACPQLNSLHTYTSAIITSVPFLDEGHTILLVPQARSHYPHLVLPEPLLSLSLSPL